jgi:hypothetical protein
MVVMIIARLDSWIWGIVQYRVYRQGLLNMYGTVGNRRFGVVLMVRSCFHGQNDRF